MGAAHPRSRSLRGRTQCPSYPHTHTHLVGQRAQAQHLAPVARNGQHDGCLGLDEAQREAACSKGAAWPWHGRTGAAYRPGWCAGCQPGHSSRPRRGLTPATTPLHGAAVVHLRWRSLAGMPPPPRSGGSTGPRSAHSCEGWRASRRSGRLRHTARRESRYEMLQDRCRGSSIPAGPGPGWLLSNQSSGGGSPGQRRQPPGPTALHGQHDPLHAESMGSAHVGAPHLGRDAAGTGLRSARA